jgi:hypothetical protein
MRITAGDARAQWTRAPQPSNGSSTGANVKTATVETRLTRWVKQERDGDLSSVAIPEKFIGDHDLTGAVKLYRSAVPQPKSCQKTVVLGD